MAHITRHGGPDDLAPAEELATQRRLAQEQANVDARAAYAEQRRHALAQERGEPYEPPTTAAEDTPAPEHVEDVLEAPAVA